ncbi:MAG: T9SS type B sorting domain-containing protein, partial [Sphingobacteriales bacterium]
MFVAHFAADGASLIGATYIGGQLGNSINAIDIFSNSGFTGQNKVSPVEITLDGQGNIWGVTNTSTIDFPVSANACQPVFGGGNCDGIVIGLNANCSQLLYGSYLGGSNTDVAYCIRFNNQGKVVVCGGTKSGNFPITANAYMGTAPGAGDWDGYVAIIDPVSGGLLRSTFMGTEQDDQCTNLQIDNDDQVYVLGRTFGNHPISNGVYALPGRDIFVSKMSPSLTSMLRSTRLGNAQTAATSFFPTTFLLDNCDHIYVGGLSQDYRKKLSNMPLSNDAFQTTPANFWFCALQPDFAGLLYGTYMGRAQDTVVSGGNTVVVAGDHTHVGTYRLDPNGILYQSICANSLHYPGTQSGAWSAYNKNSFINPTDTSVIGQDVVSFKFRFDLSGTDAGNIMMSQNDTGCAPYALQFSSYTYAAQTYTWNFGDGSPVSHDASPTHTYTQAGTYHLFLAIHNDTVICRNDDSAFATVTIFNPQLPVITVSDTMICDSLSQLTLQVHVANPGPDHQFYWQSVNGGGLISSNGATAIVNPGADTLFRITVSDTIPGFCGKSVTDTIHIDYKPRKLNILTPDTLICEGSIVAMRVQATNGYTYTWSPGGGVSDIHALNPLISPVQSATYTLTAMYPGCMDTAQSVTVSVDDKIGAPFVVSEDRICMGQQVQFTLPGADSTFSSYQWDFGDDNSRLTTDVWNATMHAYDRAGVWPVKLIAHFRACPDTSYTDTISVYAFPLVDLGSDTGLCEGCNAIYLRNLATDTMTIMNTSWNTGDTGTALKVVHPGTYTLTVAAAPIGCSTTNEIVVTKDCYIDIPNAFTPNGDGINDYFFPRQLLSKKLTRFSMQIFNRWGQIIFETNKTDGRGWDGKLNDRDQPGGVYVYLIDAEIDGQHEEHYQGNVTLVR